MSSRMTEEMLAQLEQLQEKYIRACGECDNDTTRPRKTVLEIVMLTELLMLIETLSTEIPEIQSQINEIQDYLVGRVDETDNRTRGDIFRAIRSRVALRKNQPELRNEFPAARRLDMEED